MQVVTTAIIPKPPTELWPLLCGSKMDPEIPCLFRLGIPKPVECRLPSGNVGVGEARTCVSDSGIINQRITIREPPRTLYFEMIDSNLYFRPCVTSISERFELEPYSLSSTRITRATSIQLTGVAPWLKGLIMFIGMKTVHKYVFRNWSLPRA